MNIGGFWEKFCLKVVESCPGEELNGFAQLCAKQLYTFEYYRAVEESLANS
jgi:hypothetical protein